MVITGNNRYKARMSILDGGLRINNALQKVDSQVVHATIYYHIFVRMLTLLYADDISM